MKITIHTHRTDFYWKDHNTVVTQDLEGYNDSPQEMDYDEFILSFDGPEWQQVVAALQAIRPS